MQTKALALTLLLTACGPVCEYSPPPPPSADAPARVPGRIVVTDPALQPALEEALCVWTEHWGYSPYSDDPDADIEVEIAVVSDLDPSVAALAVGNRAWGSCTIYVASDVPYLPEYAVTVLVHEIGHCLGYGHDDDPTSIMHVSAQPGGTQELKAHHRPH